MEGGGGEGERRGGEGGPWDKTNQNYARDRNSLVGQGVEEIFSRERGGGCGTSDFRALFFVLPVRAKSAKTSHTPCPVSGISGENVEQDVLYYSIIVFVREDKKTL